MRKSREKIQNLTKYQKRVIGLKIGDNRLIVNPEPNKDNDKEVNDIPPLLKRNKYISY